MSSKIFIIPHAGGSPSHFRALQKSFSLPSEVLTFEGRSGDINSEEFSKLNWSEFIENCLKTLKDNIDQDFYLFGHSFGGLIAYELLVRLEESYFNRCKGIVISSVVPPHLFKIKEKISHLPLAQFVDKLKTYGGIEEEVEKNIEAFEFFFNQVRFDFKLIEDYLPIKLYKKLSKKVFILGGKEDLVHPIVKLLDWKDYFNHSLNCKFFDNGHFYLFQEEQKVTSFLNSVLD